MSCYQNRNKCTVLSLNSRKLEQDIAHIESISTGLEAWLLMLDKFSANNNLQILGDIESISVQAQEALQNYVREIIYLREIKEQQNVG